MGALNNLVPFSLIFWGQLEITGGLASILIATTPLFTVLLAHFLTRDERITPSRLAGLALGIAGVAVMIGPEALRGLGLHLLAQLAVLGAALSYAFAGIYGRRFRGQPPLVTAAGQVSASALMMLPITLLRHLPMERPAARRRHLGRHPRPSTPRHRAGLYPLFPHPRQRRRHQPPAGDLPDPGERDPVRRRVLGERLDPEHLFGMGLIGLGLAAIDGRPLRGLGRALGLAAPNPEGRL